MGNTHPHTHTLTNHTHAHTLPHTNSHHTRTYTKQVCNLACISAVLKPLLWANANSVVLIANGYFYNLYIQYTCMYISLCETRFLFTHLLYSKCIVLICI